MAIHIEIVGTDREIPPETSARVIGEILPLVLRRYCLTRESLDSRADSCGLDDPLPDRFRNADWRG
jgi:hypothetical protein